MTCFNHNAGTVAIKAAGETVNTSVRSVIMDFFLRIGADEVCIGTSNSAANSLCSGIEDLQSKASRHVQDEDNPIRFHAWTHETTDLKHFGKGGNVMRPKTIEQVLERSRTPKNAMNLALELAMHNEERKEPEVHIFTRSETSVCHD